MGVEAAFEEDVGQEGAVSVIYAVSAEGREGGAACAVAVGVG